MKWAKIALSSSFYISSTHLTTPQILPPIPFTSFFAFSLQTICVSIDYDEPILFLPSFCLQAPHQLPNRS